MSPGNHTSLVITSQPFRNAKYQSLSFIVILQWEDGLSHSVLSMNVVNYLTHMASHGFLTKHLGSDMVHSISFPMKKSYIISSQKYYATHYLHFAQMSCGPAVCLDLN